MTQKNKNIGLGIGLFLIWLVAWQYGFKETYRLQKQASKLENQKQVYQSAPAQLAALSKKESELNKILKQNNVEGSSLQNNLLKNLNTLSKDLGFSIITFEEPHIYQDPETMQNTTTYSMTLQGDYKSLREVIFALEQKYSFGNVIHLGFEKKKNFRTGTNYLQTTILLQRLH